MREGLRPGVQIHSVCGHCYNLNSCGLSYFSVATCALNPGLEVIKLEYRLRFKLKGNDWLLADMSVCKQPIIALYFESENGSSFITSRPGPVLTVLMRLTFFPKFWRPLDPLSLCGSAHAYCSFHYLNCHFFHFSFCSICGLCQCQQNTSAFNFIELLFFCFWCRTYQGFQPLSLIHRCLWLVLISEPR